MFKGLLFGAVMAASSFGWAAPTIAETVIDITQQTILYQAHTQCLNWKVGDTANYDLNLGGFLPGTMVMSVKSIGAEGIWIDQVLDLTIQKQTMSMLLDPNTGEVKKVLVDGKEQQMPENTMEVVEVKEDKITVPAGTFECLHAILKDKKTNENADVWVNPALVPMSGMIKTIQPSQLGKVTIVLKSFKKQ